MKKIIIPFAIAFAAIFTSCSNDDIAISHTVNFTVNPSTVVAPFAAGEVHAGDLESFHTDCRLFIELFIYNEAGKLIEKRTESFSNYAVQMKASLFIPQGEYTAVAITHIDDIVDNIKYWEISNEENLEGLRITDAGLIGGENKVLGISAYNFIVDEETQDISINVQPAGSLLTVRYYNFHALDKQGIEQYRLVGNKTMDYLEFDRFGTSSVIADNHNGSYDWIYDSFIPTDYSSSYSSIYSYEFTLPLSNVGLQFQALDKNYYYELGETTLTSTAGHCYYANLYLNSNIKNVTTSFGQTRASRASGTYQDETAVRLIYNKHTASHTAGQNIHVIDILK